MHTLVFFYVFYVQYIVCLLCCVVILCCNIVLWFYVMSLRSRGSHVLVISTHVPVHCVLIAGVNPACDQSLRKCHL